MIKPCPFCGEVPELPDGLGTQYEMWCDCGMAMSCVQMVDLLDHDERRIVSFNMHTLSYPQWVIDRAKEHCISEWNHRAGWQPIETYDRLKKPPKLAVFYVKPSTVGRSFLGEMVVTERRYGYREVTHWMPLPEPPQ